jgi:hypothetical protein
LTLLESSATHTPSRLFVVSHQVSAEIIIDIVLILQCHEKQMATVGLGKMTASLQPFENIGTVKQVNCQSQ